MKLTKKIQKTVRLFLLRLSKRRDLAAARNLPIEDVRTVCLFLGPYRNLTTLTASILFLHPNCQVLNHAANRIFHDSRTDFFDGYDDEKFDTFVRYAIYASGGGGRGMLGGSITHSHAFDEGHVTRELFESTGSKLIKEKIYSLIWKESLRTSNRIRKTGIDLGTIFAKNSRLRFLLPVRNPIDCAVSNIKSGHAKLFPGLDPDAPVEKVVEAILDEFKWVRSWERKHPDRFFIYFEPEFAEETLVRLADFLKVEMNEEWKRNALAAFEIKKRYEHPEPLAMHYRRLVHERFGGDPDFSAKLLRFVEAV
jgi:hypothetical protein